MVKLHCRRCKSVDCERVRKHGIDKFFHSFRRLQVYQCDNCGARFRWYGSISFLSIFLLAGAALTLTFGAVNYDVFRADLATGFWPQQSVATSMAEERNIDTNASEGATNKDAANSEIKAVRAGGMFRDSEIAGHNPQAVLRDDHVISVEERLEINNPRNFGDTDRDNNTVSSFSVIDQPDVDIIEEIIGPKNDVVLLGADLLPDAEVEEPYSDSPDIDPNLFRQPETNYTLQIGSWKEHKLGLQSINELSKLLEEDFYYYRIGVGERAFTRILYGSFPTSAMATNAIETLPEKVRLGSPYVRKISTVLNAFN